MIGKSLLRHATAIPVMFTCLLFGVFSSARAENGAGACSNRTIQGDYGFSAEGWLINNPGLPPQAPFRSLGIVHFDGRGNLTWVEHTVVNGFPADFEGATATGTYSVDSDCSGTAIINTPNSPVPLQLALVVVKHGRELRSVLGSNAVSTTFLKID
jgi:hypothetical protein